MKPTVAIARARVGPLLYCGWWGGGGSHAVGALHLSRVGHRTGWLTDLLSAGLKIPALSVMKYFYPLADIFIYNN